MQFLILLQLVEPTAHTVNSIFVKSMVNFFLDIALVGFVISCLYGGFLSFRDFIEGNSEMARARMINVIIGCTIFGGLVVGKDDITQIISYSDTKKVTETFMMLITVMMFIIIGFSIGIFIEEKTVKYESIFEVIPVSEDGINEKYTLIEKRFIFYSLFGKPWFKKEISYQKIKSFDFLEDASEALAEIQSKDNLKPKIANLKETTTTRFNPLDPSKIPDLIIATHYAIVILNESGNEEDEDFFSREGKKYVTSIIWYLSKYYPQYCTLSHLLSIIKYGDINKIIQKLEEKEDCLVLVDTLSLVIKAEMYQLVAGVTTYIREKVKEIIPEKALDEDFDRIKKEALSLI